MSSVSTIPAELAEITTELDLAIEQDRRRALRLRAAMLNAINTVNVLVGEVALALEPDDDQRRSALGLIQHGLDDLWRESGGPEHELESASEVRRQLGAALDRIGHQSSPEFRARLADAFDEVAA